MKLIYISLLFLSCSSYQGKTLRSDIKPPLTKKMAKEFKKHGHKRVDNYYWLKDKTNPEVIDYLKKENAYAQEVMGGNKELRKDLFSEMKKRIKKDDASVPYLENGYLYYYRYESGGEYPIYCRKKENTENEEIILDVNVLAKGKKYFHVKNVVASENSQILAYGVDDTGRRKYSIHFKDLKTGKNLKDVIKNTSGTVVWSENSKIVFYTIKDNTLRPYKVLRHELSKDKDEVIYHEKDSTFNVYIGKTRSKKYLLIGTYATLTSEMWYLPSDQALSSPRLFAKREKGVEYEVSHGVDKFFIVTNHLAKNFKVMVTQENNTDRKHWKEYLPHREDVLVESVETFKDFVVVKERENGLIQMRIKTLDQKIDRFIPFEDPSYGVYLSDNKSFDTNLIRFSYYSLKIPKSVYDHDVYKNESQLIKRTEVIGYEPKLYKSERIWATSRDGTKIPISLVYRKDKKIKENPLLLYGYGSYGYSLDPYFNSNRVSLLDRGFIFAIAHIRGGQEMGKKWYEDGRQLKKKNTFTDFIDVAKHLIEEKYTNSSILFAEGGSAGGLLMGSVINMRGDLFKAVLAHVPFVDVLTTMLDASIPLTTGEYDEWGDPNKKEYYEYILSYSPYDNVSKKDYPALLVTSSLEDSQVQYWEPAKWVAKLREMKTDDNLLLLKMDLNAGHGGKSGRFSPLEDTAFSYAFMLQYL